MAISGNQLRAARSLAGIGQQELAEAAEVSINTIRNMEARGAERVRVRQDTMERIVEAFIAAGVQFTGEDTGLLGVRLINPDAAHMARYLARERRRQ